MILPNSNAGDSTLKLAPGSFPRRGGLRILTIAVAAVMLAGCSKTPEQRIAAFMAKGEAELQSKDYPRALIEFRNAARLNVDNPEPYYQAGLAYLGMGEYRSAYQNLVHTTELDPHHVKAQQKLAELISSSVTYRQDPEQLQEAEKRVRSVLAMVPDSSEALNALGLTEYLLGKPQDAIKQLENAIERAPQNLQAAWSLAGIKFKQNDFAGAESVLMKAAANSPRSAEAQLALARLFQAEQKPAEAEAAFRQALNLDPKYGPALLDFARFQLSLRKKDEAEKLIAALSELPDKEYRPLHAIYLFEQGKQEDAIKEFEKLAAADTKDRAAFARLISAYFVAKRFPEAERAIDAALKRNPKDTEVRLARSRLYLVTGKFSEAEGDLNDIAKSEPGSAIPQYLLSKVSMARGQRFQERRQLIRAVESDPTLLAARIELAQLLVADGGAEAAVDLLERMPENQKDLLPVVVARNWALLGTRSFKELRASLDKWLPVYNSTDLFMQDGLLRLQAGDGAGARASLERVLKAQPQDIRALDALAKTYMSKQPGLALEALQKYASTQSTSGPVQSLLGDWLAANKRYPEARKAFAAAIADDPGLDGTRISIAYLDIYEGNLDSARGTLESVAHNPRFTVQAQFALAIIEEKAGNVNAVIGHLRKVLEADPNNVPALNNLAYHLANDTNLSNDTNQLDEAVKYAQHVKDLAPNSVAVDDTIGWAFYRKGLYDSAVKHLEAAVNKQDTALFRYHLAMAYLKSGQRSHGIEMLAQARRLDPSLPESTAAQELLAATSKKAN